VPTFDLTSADVGTGADIRISHAIIRRNVSGMAGARAGI
jgi:hypothetical protein